MRFDEDLDPHVSVSELEAKPAPKPTNPAGWSSPAESSTIAA